MKIIGIDPDESNNKQVAYVTDPPLTQEVFDSYARTFGPTNLFRFKDGLLITQTLGMNADFLNETEQFLAQAKQQIERAKASTEQTHEDLLKSFSEQSGRPIIRKPPVPKADGNPSDTDKQ